MNDASPALDHPTLYPVVHGPRLDPKSRGVFLHRQFIRSHELGSRDPMFPADPSDRMHRVALAGRAKFCEPAELRDDLLIGQSAGEVANAADDRLGVADRLRSGWRCSKSAYCFLRSLRLSRASFQRRSSVDATHL
jgi:hypothetical protein